MSTTFGVPTNCWLYLLFSFLLLILTFSIWKDIRWFYFLFIYFFLTKNKQFFFSFSFFFSFPHFLLNQTKSKFSINHNSVTQWQHLKTTNRFLLRRSISDNYIYFKLFPIKKIVGHKKLVSITKILYKYENLLGCTSHLLSLKEPEWV